MKTAKTLGFAGSVPAVHRPLQQGLGQGHRQGRRKRVSPKRGS